MTTTISASGSSTTAWQPRREVGVSPGALSSRSSSLSSEAESALPPPFTITWQVVQAQFPPQACSRWMPCPSSTSRIDPGFPSCWKGARAGSNSITRSGSPFSKMTRILATDGNLASEVRRRDSGAARALRCKRGAMAIHYEKDGHIVTITIDRPEQRNSLDLEHFGQLADAWVRFRDDDEAYVAILTGVGDVYCVGADLKSFIPIVTERADKLREGESKLPQEGSKYTMAHSLVAVLRDGATLPDGTEFTLYKPVIAAINGICAAGGLEMMWNTDLPVCADAAWFQLAVTVGCTIGDRLQLSHARRRCPRRGVAGREGVLRRLVHDRIGPGRPRGGVDAELVVDGTVTRDAAIRECRAERHDEAAGHGAS